MATIAILPHKLKGIFREHKKLFTQSVNHSVYGESVRKAQGTFYRQWDPYRSKIGAGLALGLSQLGIKPDYSILYLGAASGTTVSHVADIVGKKGVVFAVEFSKTPVRQLIQLTKKWKNIVPILADANKPESYAQYLEIVDTVFQDIAQKNQVDIFIKNCNTYLKPNGFGLISVKAKSIDVTKKPQQIFKKVLQQLEQHMTVVDKRVLDPFQKDHILIVVKKK